MNREMVEAEVETFRQLVVGARSSLCVEAEAHHSMDRLESYFGKSPELFSVEDLRFVNALAGFLVDRLNALRPAGAAGRGDDEPGPVLCREGV